MSDVEQVLLDMGLEDLTPIPEAVDTVAKRKTAGESSPAMAVAAGLRGLLLADRVRLYRGPWRSDPTLLSASEALSLLDDPHWFRFHLDEPNEQRLFFVNVANLQDP